MKQLWTVEITEEVVVLAETKEEAERIARNIDRWDLNPEPWASPMRAYPAEWDGNSLSFVDEDEYVEQTVAQLIEAGAAPEYRK